MITVKKLTLLICKYNANIEKNERKLKITDGNNVFLKKTIAEYNYVEIRCTNANRGVF